MKSIERIVSVEKFGEAKFFFLMQRIGCFFNGIWPGDAEWTKFRLSFAIFNAMEILIYAIFQLWFIFEHGNELIVVLDALTPLATQIVVGIKLLVVRHQRHHLRVIIKYLKENFVNGELHIKFFFSYKINSTIKNSRSTDNVKAHREIHARVSRISFAFPLILCVFANLTNFFFCFMALLKDIRNPSSYALPFKAT